MSEAQELRARAENLLSMAIKAREQGLFANAESLIAEAAQFVADAEALEAADLDRPDQQSGDPKQKQ